MATIVSRLRACAIGFSAPHVVARGLVGFDLDDTQKALAGLKIEVADSQKELAKGIRFAASNAFEASCNAILSMEKDGVRSGVTYEAALDDAAVKIVETKYQFLAELDRVVEEVRAISNANGVPS